MTQAPSSGGEKTSRGHWDAGWTAMPTDRFWSPFDPTISDVNRLLAREIAPGTSLLEIGFAPGKMLAWAALERGARVSGIDYSGPGVALAKAYFARRGIEGDLRHEDIFETSFAPGSFDCVMSHGLVEHFDDPRAIVAKHVALARPGGKIILSVPNYGGLYGRLQGRLHPENLAIHNLSIMSPEGMKALFPAGGMASVRAFLCGRPTLWGLAIETRMPAALARQLKRAVGLAGWLLPLSPAALKPIVIAIGIKE